MHWRRFWQRRRSRRAARSAVSIQRALVSLCAGDAFVASMLRGSACPPSPCALPSASPRRAVAARSVAGKDRGEWTRFLEWSDSDGGDKATVEVTLLSGSASVAEVSVEAPDRPGLLGDIANTLSSSGLNIEKVSERGCEVGEGSRYSAVADEVCAHRGRAAWPRHGLYGTAAVTAARRPGSACWRVAEG